MDILQRQFEKILTMKHFYTITNIALMCLLFACGSGEVTEETDSSDTTHIKTVKEANIQDITVPDALSNFDKTFTGSFGESQIQMNLRRYGNSLSGTYWQINGLEEIALKGIIQEDGNDFILSAQDVAGDKIGEFIGILDEDQSLKGNWKSNAGEEKVFNLTEIQEGNIVNLKVDDLELHQDSPDGKRKLKINYPLLLGITNKAIADKVNREIEYYFEEATLLDSIDVATLEFSEDVKFEVTFLGNELISICKNHHLSKNSDTHIFEDSHGININFKRGKVYEIQDLFKPNAIDQLNALIIGRISKSCGNMLSDKDLENCKIQLNESKSFSLSRKNQNITFHLTERLPYKYRGCGYVRISYEDLKEYFNPSGPLSSVLEKS